MDEPPIPKHRGDSEHAKHHRHRDPREPEPAPGFPPARVSVRRIDQKFHVVVTEDGLEHTHNKGMDDRSRAWKLAKRVRRHLEDGNALHLVHWHTEGGAATDDPDTFPSEPTAPLPIQGEVPIQTGLVTLEGFLGADPEYRETRERWTTVTRTRREQFTFEYCNTQSHDEHDILEDEESFERHHTPRGYAVLSLATHEGHTTSWHRIIAWNTDHQHFGLFRLGKGNLVEIQARPTTFRTQDGRTLEQLELVDFRLLRRKPRHTAEEWMAAA